MTTRSQLGTLRGKMDELEAEILDTKRAVAAAQSTTELDFLRKQLLLLQEKENILLRGQASGQNEVEYNTDAPLYSWFLANTLNMRTPYEQYGVYLTALGGSAYMANSFFRAYNLAKYVKVKDIPGQHIEAQFAADMARVAPHELERAGRTIARLKVRGVAAAIASPVLWIAWRLVSQTPTWSNKKRKDT